MCIIYRYHGAVIFMIISLYKGRRVCVIKARNNAMFDPLLGDDYIYTTPRKHPAFGYSRTQSDFSFSFFFDYELP